MTDPTNRPPRQPAAALSDERSTTPPPNEAWNVGTAGVGDAELETLASLLRRPIEPDPFSSESACQKAIDVIAAIGRDPSRSELPPANSGKQPETREFGQYRLLATLGEGGMGTIYRALHIPLGRIVALKMLPADRMQDESAIARFNREMQAVGTLKHPNVVTAHDGGEIDGTHYLVMELVDGLDLGAMVRRLGPLPIGAACEVIRQAALGLQHAHAHELVHRDVKPSNLMLTREGEIKLLDLGLARLGEQQVAGSELTNTGQMMGTFEYMAPEQGSDSHSVDHRADIYSLGATLYKLLTGQAPFAGERYDTPLKRMMALATEEPQPIRQLRSDVPKSVATLLHRLLEKGPDRRVQSAAEVAAALAPYADGSELPDLVARAMETAPDQTTEPKTAATEPAASSAFEDTAPTASPGSLPAGGLGVTASLRPGSALRKPQKSGGWRQPLVFAARRIPPRYRWLVAGALGFSAVIAIGLLLSIRTPSGMLVIESDDPSVQVAVKQNGQIVDVASAKRGWQLSLQDGKYDVELTEDRQRLVLSEDHVTLTRGGRTVLRVIWRPASHVVGLEEAAQSDPAKCFAEGLMQAPFNAAEAQKGQRAWAKRLGMPVETMNSIGMKLVLIPPGEFDMGSTKEEVAPLLEKAKREDKVDKIVVTMLPSEAPKHRVKITKPFYMGITEVTQEQYKKITGKNPSRFTGNPSRPVEQVTWYDTIEFCDILSQKEGKKYRLPTEAEWEYACRAGSTTKWCFGDNEAELEDYAWFGAWFSDAPGETHPVAQKEANAFGLYDIHGNVHEFCQDWFEREYYSHSPTVDPRGPDTGEGRVHRGGCLGCRATRCRSATRGPTPLHLTYNHLGFRVVCAVTEDLKLAQPFPEQASVEDQKAWVIAELKRLNPKYDGSAHFTVENGKIVGLSIHSTPIKDITPIGVLRDLKRFYCPRTKIVDLSPLKGMPLVQLDIGMTGVNDLSPLRGMPLVNLSCPWARITDLSPLKGMPLERLDCGCTPITDLSPLVGMPLKELYVFGAKVTDFRPIAKLPLEKLDCSFDPKRDLGAIRSISTLKTFKSRAATEVLKEAEERLKQSSQIEKSSQAKPFPERGTLTEQKAWLVAELKRLNPGFDGNLRLVAERGNIMGLELQGGGVADISPLAELKTLRSLSCQSMPVEDITPISGLRLVSVRFYGCKKVFDIEPLRRMPLKSVNLQSTNVSDLSPLEGKPLEFLDVYKTPVADFSMLQGMPLKSLNVGSTKFYDCSLLEGMPLESLCLLGSRTSDLAPLAKHRTLKSLEIAFTSVSDVTPLADLSLNFLDLLDCKITNLTPLKRSSLQQLRANEKLIERNVDVLREIPGLKIINNRPADDVLREAEEKLKHSSQAEKPSGNRSAD